MEQEKNPKNKKRRAILLMILPFILILGTLIMIGERNANETVEILIGHWNIVNDECWIIFEENGIGNRNFNNSQQTFRWRVSNRQLTLTFDDGSRNEIWIVNAIDNDNIIFNISEYSSDEQRMRFGRHLSFNRQP